MAPTAPKPTRRMSLRGPDILLSSNRNKAVRGDEILKLRPTLFCLQRLVRTVGISILSPAWRRNNEILYNVRSFSVHSPLYLIPISFFCFLQLQRVASLSLTLQSTTFAGQPSLLIWQRQDGDGTGALDFNLWFVHGTDQQDAGIATPEVHASSDQLSGSVQVVFPKVGYVGHGISARNIAKMFKLVLMR